MMNRVSLLALCVAVVGISLVALMRLTDRREPVARGSPSVGRATVGSSIKHQNRPSHLYGKIELPAELSIGLGQAENGNGPVEIVVGVSSLVPVHSGILTLMLPAIGAEPNRTELLWAGTPADFVTETAVYRVDALPVGQHCFTVAFEFTPSAADADRIATSQSLYLDVRPTGILSSNVSFEQIRRLELRRELERRIVATHKPGPAIAGEQAIDDELARLEAADPGFLDRKIAELKATDPDVARRILELNERQAEASGNSRE